MLPVIPFSLPIAAKNISVDVVPTFLPNYVVDGFGGFNPYGLRRKVTFKFWC